MISDGALRAGLAVRWGLPDATLEPHHSGMNSAPPSRGCTNCSAASRWRERTGSTGWTQGLLHTDPAPEAFRMDPATGVCGVIDWGTAMIGPFLYDLASAVMYADGPGRAGPLVAAYLERVVVPRAEVERGLLVMLRFRHAVQADYFPTAWWPGT